jgi:DnaJ-domain-containing protein 1
MSWKGKVIGLLVGLLTRRWQLILLGLAIGHLYDMGVFSGGYKPRPERAPPPASEAEDPYAVLGIASGASDEELEQAYRRRMSEYHPDRVANAAKEIRDMADRRAREINQAYDRIKRQRGIP